MEGLVSIFQKIRQKYKNGLVMQVILGYIADCGLFINPYYIFQEGLSGEKHEEFRFEFEKCETIYLGPEDMKEIDRIDGREFTGATLCERLTKGNKCFALKIDSKIVGFTWCNFNIFNYPPAYEFKLKEDEAYLFDTYVLRAYRGLNIAPLMRHSLYQELDRMGRNVLYSASECFNTPAIRFKNKVGARVVRLLIYIELGKRFHWHWKLKSYEKACLQKDTLTMAKKLNSICS